MPFDAKLADGMADLPEPRLVGAGEGRALKNDDVWREQPYLFHEQIRFAATINVRPILPPPLGRPFVTHL